MMNMLSVIVDLALQDSLQIVYQPLLDVLGQSILQQTLHAANFLHTDQIPQEGHR